LNIVYNVESLEIGIDYSALELALWNLNIFISSVWDAVMILKGGKNYMRII
tara:strand:+ start:568 stop:720 length:153 start_codon:yes stop_codon:yes gene_type:complete